MIPKEIEPSEDFLDYLGQALQDLYAEIDFALENCLEGRVGLWGLYDRLPVTSRLKMDVSLCRGFLHTASAVALKLFSTIPYPVPASRAEELVLYWAVQDAVQLVVMDQDIASKEGEAFPSELPEAIQEEAEAFISDFFKGTDFLMLYDPSLDGIEKMEEAKAMRIGSLAVENWFLPFNEDLPVHPFTWPSEFQFRPEKWKGFKYPE